MQRTRKNRNRRRRGFTLLEVLLVVGIIALLAAFVVPSFMGTEKRAKMKLAEAMVDSGGTIATQIELYRMAMDKFPEELKDLSEKPDDEDEVAKWGGPYITDPTKLKDPWRNDLQYKYPGDVNEGSYDLWSMGPDGEDASDDDIKNWSSDK